MGRDQEAEKGGAEDSGAGLLGGRASAAATAIISMKKAEKSDDDGDPCAGDEDEGNAENPGPARDVGEPVAHVDSYG